MPSNVQKTIYSPVVKQQLHGVAELPPPPGWWLVQLTAAFAGIFCVVLAVLALWGAAACREPCIVSGHRQRALAAAGKCACGTGTLLAICGWG